MKAYIWQQPLRFTYVHFQRDPFQNLLQCLEIFPLRVGWPWVPLQLKMRAQFKKHTDPMQSRARETVFSQTFSRDRSWVKFHFQMCNLDDFEASEAG